MPNLTPRPRLAGWLLLCAGCMTSAVAAPRAHAQIDTPSSPDESDELEPTFSVNGMLRIQAGVFAPLASSGFKPHHNRAYEFSDGRPLRPCDPVAMPYAPCLPVDHGQEPGSASLARATLQLEAHWAPAEAIALHAIVRGVRSLSLAADQYAQVPEPPIDPAERRAYAENYVHDSYYTELDLRELYLDLTPHKSFSIRLGRQQIGWGETTSFRLLDVVNPTNNTWHFGPLESFEDVRIPLWMADVNLDIEPLRATLELLWVPLIDRPRDTVTVPLTFAGAWGVPYSNAPTSFFTLKRDFRYPGGRFSDSRAGVRLKGDLGRRASYSLVYYFTHQINTPIPVYFKQALNDGVAVTLPDGKTPLVDKVVLEYPRQHIAGFTFEYAFESPIGTALRAEASLEPNRTYPARSDIGALQDPNDPARYNFTPSREMVVNYALSAQRSTMIRFLNPSQSFLFFAQFVHSAVPTLDTDGPDSKLVEVPIYNAWQAQKHSFSLALMIRTSYLRGRLSPRVTGAWLPNRYAGDSGFYSIDLDVRLSTHYLLNLRYSDFWGKDPYRELGLFRDRDELHAALTIQF
jgi:hypothetical protein